MKFSRNVFMFMMASAFIWHMTSASTHLALAEETPTKANNLYTLPAITVTADKRATEVQKTPIALTVITSQDLEDKNIKTVKEALAQVPNLMITENMGGRAMMSFRGATNTPSDTSSIVIYVDGVPVDSVFGIDANLIDIERIEVLRGPQSAIYGKNALGGVINIISKRPTNDYAGKISAYGESWQGFGLNGTVSGPLIEDKLFFSIAASHDSSNGWMDSPNTDKGNEESSSRVKGQLLFTPSEKVEFSLHADYSAIRDGYSPYVLGNDYSRTSPASQDDKDHVDFFNIALRGMVEFDAAIAESITTYRNENTRFVMDAGPWAPLPGSALQGNDRIISEFTQEFRLRSPDNKPGMSWLLGAYGSYAYYDMDILQEYDYLGAPGFMSNSSYDQYFTQNTFEFAPFAQVVIPISDAFKVTAGLRWHYTERSASFERVPDAQLSLLPPPLNASFAYANSDRQDSWNEFLPKLVLSYDITDDHMVYAGVSRSFAPGGYNYAAVEGDLTYDSQTAWNYEIGAKTAWLNDRFMANIAFFYSQFENLQVFQYDAGTNLFVADNAGEATSYGAEVDLTARLAKGLDAQVGFGYTHARYDKYVDALGNSLDKNRVELTPEVTLNGSLTYRHENGFFATASAYYISQLYWDAGNTEERDPITTVNAKVGYQGDNFEAYVYGKNVFDARYLSYYNSASRVGFIAEPQTFGVELAYRF